MNVCFVSLIAQLLALFQVIGSLSERVIALSNIPDYIARISFTICIYLIIGADFKSIKVNHAAKICGLAGHNSFLDDFVYYFRTFISKGALILITWYLVTIEPNGSEDNLDLVKDFTALVIIVEIDNMITPENAVEFDDLQVHNEDETVEEKF